MSSGCLVQAALASGLGGRRVSRMGGGTSLLTRRAVARGVLGVSGRRYLAVDSERAGEHSCEAISPGARSRRELLRRPGRDHARRPAHQRPAGVHQPDHGKGPAAGGRVGAAQARLCRSCWCWTAALARPLAALAVAAVAARLGELAQYPYLLPPGLTIAASAAPTGTEATELVVVFIIAVLVAPSFVLLFRLAQGGHLRDPEAALAGGHAPQTTRRRPGSRPGTPRRAGSRAGRRLSGWKKRTPGGQICSPRDRHPGRPAATRQGGRPSAADFARGFRYVLALRRSRCGTTTYLGSWWRRRRPGTCRSAAERCRRAGPGRPRRPRPGCGGPP